MRANHTRDRLLRGETVFGCAMQFYRSTEIPRAFAAAGFNYIFVDLEHGGFDLETAQDIIAASVTAGLTPLVRVSELTYSLIARILDVGAQGIILPRVECLSTLEDAIAWTKYPPEGKRGFGFLAPLLDYERRSVAEIMAHLNQTTLVVVQFETRTAMESAINTRLSRASNAATLLKRDFGRSGASGLSERAASRACCSRSAPRWSANCDPR
jgi:2-keto-3-deoxy-L-rhamnonate aldolase RhmA